MNKDVGLGMLYGFTLFVVILVVIFGSHEAGQKYQRSIYRSVAASTVEIQMLNSFDKRLGYQE